MEKTSSTNVSKDDIVKAIEKDLTDLVAIVLATGGFGTIEINLKNSRVNQMQLCLSVKPENNPGA